MQSHSLQNIHNWKYNTLLLKILPNDLVFVVYMMTSVASTYSLYKYLFVCSSNPLLLVFCLVCKHILLYFPHISIIITSFYTFFEPCLNFLSPQRKSHYFRHLLPCISFTLLLYNTHLLKLKVRTNNSFPLYYLIFSQLNFFNLQSNYND